MLMNNAIIGSLMLISTILLVAVLPWSVNFDVDSDKQKMIDRDCKPILSDWNNTPAGWNCPFYR